MRTQQICIIYRSGEKCVEKIQRLSENSPIEEMCEIGNLFFIVVNETAIDFSHPSANNCHIFTA